MRRGVLAAAGGTGAAFGPARSVVWLAAMAAVAAGNDLPSGPAAAVTVRRAGASQRW